MSAVAKNKQQELIDEASALVSRLTGIQLGAKQNAMVQARLSKRMIELRMSPEEYLDYIRNNPDKENTILISLLTTHHTFFFRESAHFDFLAQEGLKALVASIRAQGRKTLRIWSAASSWGHEIYSLSMVLQAHLREVAPDFNYEILGTDVDPESVAIARNGVYKWDELKGVPASYMGSHWSRGTGDIANFVKAKKSIKDPCRFDVCNLTELDRETPSQKFDVIFCRNVLIYFNQEQIKSIATQLLRRLEPHGFLFLGISESLMGLDLPVNYGGPSIYIHKNSSKVAEKSSEKPIERSSSKSATPAMAAAPVAPVAPAPHRTIRLLCVDDSPVVLSLLKKIFSTEPGFEVVATAANGLEAAEMLRKHKVDAMTLDIHMPKQTGLEYLQKNIGPTHPPVVMVTSVSREDSALGLKCLEVGAKDFVEKPSLNNLAEKGEELRMKIRCAVRPGPSASQGMVDVARSFAKTAAILNPERKLRVIVCSMADRERLGKTLREIKGAQPATLVLVQGGENVFQGMIPKLSSSCASKLEIWDGKSAPTSGFYIADFATAVSEFENRFGTRRFSMLVMGDVTGEVSKKIVSWCSVKNAQLVVEDGSGFSKTHQDLKSVAADAVPVTSFVYTADMHLSRDI